MQGKYLIEINVKNDSGYVTRFEQIFNDNEQIAEIVNKATDWTCRQLNELEAKGHDQTNPNNRA